MSRDEEDEVRDLLREGRQLQLPLVDRLERLIAGQGRRLYEQEGDDIRDELERLRVRQAGLIDRLERLVPAMAQRAAALNRGRTLRTPTGPATRVEPRPRAVRPFVIGDRVRIVNPSRSQSKIGTIVKISPSRITVANRNGTTISRAPKNIAFIRE